MINLSVRITRYPPDMNKCLNEKKTIRFEFRVASIP